MAEAKSSGATDAFVFSLSYKLVLVLTVLGSSFFCVGNCFCNGCDSNQVCCRDTCIYGSNCSGYYCGSRRDCSSGESCCSSGCVNGSSCLGHSCLTDSDCGSGESCCNQKCKYGAGCIGYSCTTSSDCGNYEKCCDGSCSSGDCLDVNLSVIAASLIICVLLFVVIFAVLFSSRRNRSRRVLLGQRAASTANLAQASQSHEDPTPPSYQESYTSFPPLPTYEQYLPSRSSEPPPPYNAETQREVCAPERSYGAVSNSTAMMAV